MKDDVFKAGFARVDITPQLGTPVVGYFEERRAKRILDPLEANALAVSAGDSTAVIIAADLLGIEGVSFNDTLLRRVAAAAGVPVEAVYLHCNHTHTGPGAGVADSGRCNLFDGTDEYNDLLLERLAEVARLAVADLSPASIATGASCARRISFIRRYRMKDGSLRTNPGVNNPEIDSPVGEVDESVQVLRIRREGKDEIAVLNFGTHPDVVGGENISGDWPAFARRTFERAEEGVKCIVFNGAQGDVNHVCTDPRLGEREGLSPDFDDVDRGYAHARHMGRVVAAAGLSVWGKCVPVDAGYVRFCRQNVRVPAQKAAPEDLPEARRIDELHKAGRDDELPYKGMAQSQGGIAVRDYGVYVFDQWLVRIFPCRFGLPGRRIRGALVRVRFVGRRCSEGRSAGLVERSGPALLTGAAPCATMRGVLGHGVLKRCGMATD